MATYKYSAFLTITQDGSFDTVHTPGFLAPFSGIYRCEGCGREAACNYGQPLPPENRQQHPHLPEYGPIRWRMVIWADHRPKK